MSFNNSNNVYVFGAEKFRKEKEIQSETAITVLSSALKAPKNLFDILKKQDYGFKICEIVKDTVKPVPGDLKECGGRFFDQKKKILIENPTIGVEIVIDCEVHTGFTSGVGGTQTFAYQSMVGVVMTINCFDKEDCLIPGIVEAQQEILEVIAKDKLKDITTILQICKILLHSAGLMNITGATWKRLNASLGQPNGKTYVKTPSPKKTIKGKEKVVEKEKEKEKEPEQEACKELFTFEGMKEVVSSESGRNWRGHVLFGDEEDSELPEPYIPPRGHLPGENKERDADLAWMDEIFGKKGSIASSMVSMSREKRKPKTGQPKQTLLQKLEHYEWLDGLSPKDQKAYAEDHPEVWKKFCEGGWKNRM